jgi:hypothetical protein
MRDNIETHRPTGETWFAPEGMEASRQKFNRMPFKVEHSLTGLEIFDVKRLAAVSR